MSPNQVYSNLYESHSLSSLVLMSRVLSTLTLHCGGRVAVQSMPRRMLEESQARYEEADQFINIPLRSREVRVSIFFKENAEGLWRCSLRSKGPIDVAAIARDYGGGGHRTAAGFKCARPTDGHPGGNPGRAAEKIFRLRCPSMRFAPRAPVLLLAGLILFSACRRESPPQGEPARSAGSAPLPPLEPRRTSSPFPRYRWSAARASPRC